ncbi:hypothetical protein A3L04_01955 [Thermococcus chitonophagus]|uniref:DUF3201 domain-containing protein n=1 Tax=Thermococcus chitonophagus TaxID=54262 RepID=A0A160VQN4_9EURY|nr:DUF3201 domain-containing protein [Thermococcus chitonophagus]ASJ15924.1 hypothetical protein A3L04_01955 [Thermococcus chitonophagus]CUX77167.1 hypothetical protein CHITON_0388 [Thermococcus chitonophagus]
MMIREVHELLNKMWEGIFELREELRQELEDFEVEEVGEVFNAYLYIDSRWEEMKYPHPAFTIRPAGEVGATPQGFYFVFAFPKEEITEDFVREFIEGFGRAFIYGMENFLDDFYNYERPISPADVWRKIRESDEEMINFEVDFSFDKEEVKRDLLKFIELARRFNLL